MGEEADEILSSFCLTEEDAKKYDTVKTKFESHFIKRQNVVFERAKFNQRVQEESESADAFITSLYCLAKKCNYGNLHDELICDRIVVGLRDTTVSLKLQTDAELTLEKAVTAARQTETVKLQQSIIRGKPTSIQVDMVGEVGKKPLPKDRSGKPFTSSGRCMWCGRSPSHGFQQCPAKEAICYKCSRRGHFKAMCRSKVSVRAVEDTQEENADMQEDFLGAVHDSESRSSLWSITLKVNGLPITFKIDTGVDVSIISESTFKALGLPLRPTTRSLRGPSWGPLNVQGSISTNLIYGEIGTREELFIVHGLQQALLGRPAIEALKLLSRVNMVEDVRGTEDIVLKYADRFEGLGKLAGEYHIELEPGAKPYALSTPRRVAVLVIPKVKEELQRMEQMGIIRQVTEPSEWCAGMVVVPKASGKVRICVDLTKLNKSVRRERHVLPSVEETLAQLGGAKISSKLDANSGFWQIGLSEQSSMLTTFITPFGWFCFNHLPFGITSGPEYFQKRISDILAGLEGVVNMIDDTLVYGRTQEEHDKRLAATLEKIRQAGVTLNKEKCEFSRTQVKFLGQIVDGKGVQPCRSR